jgi:hypothetical protein
LDLLEVDDTGGLVVLDEQLEEKTEKSQDNNEEFGTLFE